MQSRARGRLTRNEKNRHKRIRIFEKKSNQSFVHINIRVIKCGGFCCMWLILRQNRKIRNLIHKKLIHFNTWQRMPFSQSRGFKSTKFSWRVGPNQGGASYDRNTEQNSTVYEIANLYFLIRIY